MRGEERGIREPVLEEVAMKRERNRQVGARAHRQMHVRLPGQRRRPRIDDDEARAVALSLAHVRHQMNAGQPRGSRPR